VLLPASSAQLVWCRLLAFLVLRLIQASLAYVEAKRAVGYQLSRLNRIWVYAVFVCITWGASSVIGNALRGLLLEPFAIKSSSMEPALEQGDQVYIFKRGPGARLERGSVIVWTDHRIDRALASRIVAFGGDDTKAAEFGNARLRPSLRASTFVSPLRVVADRCPNQEQRRYPHGFSRSQTTGENHMRLIIIGAGFAGMYAALSAARLRDIQGVSPEELEIALVAPEPTLVVRPRLYEPKPETLTAPLLDVLKAIDVVYVQGSAETIDTKSHAVEVLTAKGSRKTLSYDRLVVATGSRLFRPNIPGLAEHGFSVDNLDDAVALDKHLHSLAERPALNGRDTVVVAGGGFTGIEAATEVPSRLREILGKDARTRVIIVERNGAIAPDMGEGPRPIIEEALRKLSVETRLGAGVAALDKSGVTLSDGERIEAETVIWAGGIRAAPLTAQIPAERDNFGRLLVDRDLRVLSVPGVFATGDAARAASDDLGNYALMSCQHATRMGAFAGNNAAAELLGVPTKPYHQKAYVTCLDLGEAGALFTRGWERKVELVGDVAKKTKHEINTVWIYPPKAERAAALASADPERVTDL